MRDIKQMLVQPGAEVFDRESLLREVLATRLMAWLQARRFYNHQLDELRSIAHDIMGVPVGKLSECLPADVARLNFVDFDCLSAVNLRECVRQAFKYVGVTEKTGVDLLGAARWAALQKRIETLSDSATQATDGDSAALPSSINSRWAQLALAELVARLFGGRGFSICDVTGLAEALNSVRDALEIPRHDPKGVTLAALRAMHCRDWAEIDPVVRSGVKGAVWEVCGLCDEVGEVAFGEHWERVKALDVASVEASSSPAVPARWAGDSRLRRVGDLLAVVGVIAGVVAGGVVGFAAGRGKERSEAVAWSLRDGAERSVRPWVAEGKGLVQPQPDVGVLMQVPAGPVFEPEGVARPQKCQGDQC